MCLKGLPLQIYSKFVNPGNDVGTRLQAHLKVTLSHFHNLKYRSVSASKDVKALALSNPALNTNLQRFQKSCTKIWP
jgi:hypothetical protein